jgi:hypothetical protein
MNFTQMHDRLRQEMLRRIERGTLSVSLLARQAEFSQVHVSNFLHNKRRLSLKAIDCILAAQHLTALDLLPAAQVMRLAEEEEASVVPIVSHGAAFFEPFIRPAAARGTIQVPAKVLMQMRARAPGSRRAWQRFVVVRVQDDDALAMEPVLLPGALVLLDRHYTSLTPYNAQNGKPGRPNLCAVRHGAHLTLRYAEYLTNRLVLRPHNVEFPVELIEADPGGSPTELVAGRAALILNET